MSQIIYLNGQPINDAIDVSGDLFGEETLAFDLPSHLVIDQTASIKWIGPIEEEDAEVIQRVFRIDTDKLVGKKVRVLIEPLGPAKTGR